MVREIVRDQTILELAEGFGVLPGEEEEAEVDAAIESIKKNVVSTGLTYEEYLARFYRTPEVQRAGMLLNNYTYGAVFGYLYDRNHAVIDRSPETIREQMAKTGCSLRLVLDGGVYRLEAARKLAQSLRALITDAWEYAETVSDKVTALSALTGFLADYDRAAAENSMVSSFEEYANRQRLLKELLESGRIHIGKNQDKGLSTTTVRSVHLMLHCALDRAVKERLIQRNPSEDCIVPKPRKLDIKILPPEHIHAYLEAAQARGLLGSQPT